MFRRLSLEGVAEWRRANAPPQQAASIWSKLGICMAAPRMPRKLAAFRQSSHQLREAEHLIEISFEPVPGLRLADFLFSEKPFEIDAADGCGGVIKAAAHIGFLSYFFDEFGRDIESFRFAVHQHGDLVLGMEDLAVGAMTGGPATGAFPFDKGTGQHFAPSAEAPDEPAAPFQVRLRGLFNRTRSIVSDSA